MSEPYIKNILYSLQSLHILINNDFQKKLHVLYYIRRYDVCSVGYVLYDLYNSGTQRTSNPYNL